MQVQNHDGALLIGATPILAADGWEHAYYIDYRNDKAKWVDAFTHMTDWASAANASTPSPWIDRLQQPSACQSVQQSCW